MMRWEQINWEYGEWRIPDSTNGEPVTIALTNRAIEILFRRKQVSKSVWVFPRENNDEKYFAKTQHVWKRIKQRASLYLWRQDEKTSTWLNKKDNKLPEHYSEHIIFKEITNYVSKENIQLHNIMDVRIHDIRRTFGSYQAIGGTSLQNIGKSLGHKSAQATEIYARLNIDPVRKSIETATNLMFQLRAS